VFNLTGGNLQNALTQLSGEANVDGQAVTFQQMTQFLTLMLDPFVFGRNGVGGGAGALGFAPEQEAYFPSDIALAYNAILKAPPPKPATLDQRWTAWGTAYGGSDKTNGDPTIGSNTFTANTFGFAAGMDYHPAPDTILGFALAGGGTNWTLAQALGSGRSDAFQAGIYGTKYFGPAYVAGSLAVANNWMTTNRTALGDQLTSSFNAQSVGGRVEAGYRYAAQPAIGVTPYGALQAQNFHTPSRSETDLTGGGFGLSFAAMNATDTRSELGARVDGLTTLNGLPLILRGRLAWAHDWVSNPALSAVFQALPGASFVVNGAALPANSALASAGAELKLNPHVSLLGKFDGEFANGSQTYAGTGTLRYTW
jgi:outer membrane autotransporter protein